MTTIVNTPPAPKESGGGMGMIIGLIVLIAMGYLFFVYGIPAIQRVQVGTPQINIPSKIDVNINQPSQ
jgi:hypothetical protein